MQQHRSSDRMRQWRNWAGALSLFGAEAAFLATTAMLRFLLLLQDEAGISFAGMARIGGRVAAAVGSDIVALGPWFVLAAIGYVVWALPGQHGAGALRRRLVRWLAVPAAAFVVLCLLDWTAIDNDTSPSRTWLMTGRWQLPPTFAAWPTAVQATAAVGVAAVAWLAGRLVARAGAQAAMALSRTLRLGRSPAAAVLTVALAGAHAAVTYDWVTDGEAPADAATLVQRGPRDTNPVATTVAVVADLRHQHASFQMSGLFGDDEAEAFRTIAAMRGRPFDEDSLVANLAQQTGDMPWREHPHVVAVLVEGLGSYALRYHTPERPLLGAAAKHLDGGELIRVDAFTTSADSFLPAVAHSLTSMPFAERGVDPTAIITGHAETMLNVPLPSAAARVFAAAGYDTTLIVDGDPAWAGLATFAERQGFQRVIGRSPDERRTADELPGTLSWDEPVYTAIERLLREAQRPQLIVALERAVRAPYLNAAPQPWLAELPRDWAHVDAATVRAWASAVHGAADRFGQFVTALDAAGLSERTLAAWTGTHSDRPDGLVTGNRDPLGHYGVPLWLHVPAEQRTQLEPPSDYGSLADLFPTLQHLSLQHRRFEALGVNLFDPSVAHIALLPDHMALGAFGVVNAVGRDQCWAWQDEPSWHVTPGRCHPLLRDVARYYWSVVAAAEIYVNRRALPPGLRWLLGPS